MRVEELCLPEPLLANFDVYYIPASEASRDEREKAISRAVKDVEAGQFPSVRKAAEHHGVSYVALCRRLNRSKS